ncbi:MAG TPA: hypothetical protein VIE63_04970 [Ramlibacter sp.]
MKQAVANMPAATQAALLPSLEPRDQALLADEARYCPSQLLWAFALLMAGHARPVCTAMMLGDREYAMWQLARAHTLHDAQLREIAARLFAYFDDERAREPVRVRAA